MILIKILEKNRWDPLNFFEKWTFLKMSKNEKKFEEFS